MKSESLPELHDRRSERLGPTFILIGAAKCATSALHLLLPRHPRVYMVQGERKFFAQDAVYERGWPWYADLFSAPGYSAYGEGSNHYTMRELYPACARRMRAHVPGARLIYVTRDPVERSVAHWLQKRQNGNPVHHVLDRALRRSSEALVDPSNYLRQLEAYRDLFPEEQILVQFYEDFVRDPVGFLRRCFEFIGVDAIELDDRVARERVNPSVGKQVDGATLAMIRRWPGYRTVKGVFPGSLRRWFKNRFLRPRITRVPEIRPDTRRWMLDRIGADCEEFLLRHGKPRDFWRL